jgi:DNA-binding transcriptional LysR family regulator
VIELAQVQELDLVLPTKRHGLRGVLDAAAQAADVLLAPRFEIDVLSAIVKLVENTGFATILPRIVVERSVQRGTMRAYPILAPRIVRHIVRINHPRRPISAATEALTAIIADELRQVSGLSSTDTAQS